MPNIIHITDFSAPELDIFARKTENQLLNREHPEEGIFIAESPKVVERALDAGYAPVSVLVEDRHIEGEAQQILERDPTEELWSYIKAVAEGKESKNEQCGYREIAIFKDGVTL